MTKSFNKHISTASEQPAPTTPTSLILITQTSIKTSKISFQSKTKAPVSHTAWEVAEVVETSNKEIDSLMNWVSNKT